MIAPYRPPMRPQASLYASIFEVQMITLDMLFTGKEFSEIDAAYLSPEKRGGQTFHQYVLTKFVEPNMGKINKVTGQENDARYMAYMLEHVFSVYHQHPSTPEPSNGCRPQSPMG